MGPTWAHLGPTGPRWAPCWPHELCYLGRCPAAACPPNVRDIYTSILTANDTSHQMPVWVGEGQWNSPKGYYEINRPQKNTDPRQVTWLHSFCAITWMFWTWTVVDTLGVGQSNIEAYSFKMSSKTASGTLLICRIYWICVSYLGFWVGGVGCGYLSAP